MWLTKLILAKYGTHLQPSLHQAEDHSRWKKIVKDAGGFAFVKGQPNEEPTEEQGTLGLERICFDM